MTSKPVRRHDLYVYELSDEVLNSLQLIKFDLNLNEVSKVPVVNLGKGKGKERESKDLAGINHLRLLKPVRATHRIAFRLLHIPQFQTA